MRTNKFDCSNLIESFAFFSHRPHVDHEFTVWKAPQQKKVWWNRELWTTQVAVRHSSLGKSKKTRIEWIVDTFLCSRSCPSIDTDNCRRPLWSVMVLWGHWICWCLWNASHVQHSWCGRPPNVLPNVSVGNVCAKQFIIVFQMGQWWLESIPFRFVGVCMLLIALWTTRILFNLVNNVTAHKTDNCSTKCCSWRQFN